jgi:hypothetical protein
MRPDPRDNYKEVASMSKHATSMFRQKTWEEKPYDAVEGEATLTRASVTNSFHGDIEGEGTLEYLMAYPNNDFCRFVGLHCVIGRIGDRSGGFLLRHDGVFENGTSRTELYVVEGSGTGELRGLRGEHGFHRPRDREHRAGLRLRVTGHRASHKRT